jgi:integrase/recombinase XerD
VEDLICGANRKTGGVMKKNTSTQKGRDFRHVISEQYESLVQFAGTLKLRDLSFNTQSEYRRYLRRMAERLGCDPATLNEAQVRSYILRLKDQHGYAPKTMRTVVAALRGFYGHHLGHEWKLFDLVRARDTVKLPVVLTRPEVARLFGAIHTPRFRTILRLIYACGLRISDGARQRGDGHADGVARSEAEGGEGGCPAGAA